MQKTTKKVLTASALALGLITAATTASAATIATTGIASTRHNLGSSNRTANGFTTPTTYGMARPGDIFTSATDEVCVFCHTPHAANLTVNAPLWNKALANPASAYTTYSSGTMQGSSVLNNNSMSLACLSCHDGTQAMDNMINKPSTGTPSSAGYNATGAGYSTTFWSGEGTDTVGGALNAKVYMELGTDLSNDHPVGIPYCGGGQTASGSNAGCADQDFVGASASGSGFVVGSDPVQKNNMRLYGSAVGSATVECASCHDPHNDAQKTFLRISNSGSAVCLACHVK